MESRQTTEPVKRLFTLLAQNFSKQKNKLDERAINTGKATYGDSLLSAMSKAEKLVCESDETNLGSLLMVGARALKTEAEPLLPFVLFELGKACTPENALTLTTYQDGLKNAVMSVVRVGGVRYGQGSLLDALIPASETAHEADNLAKALTGAAKVAGETAQRTKHPGMTSVALVLDGIAQVFKEDT